MDNTLNRREFVKSAGIAALGVLASPVANSVQSPSEVQAEPPHGAAPEFPKGFY